MAQNIRITITPEMEKALATLRLSTSGTLNTTELFKYAVGELSFIKKQKMADTEEMTPQDLDMIGARNFYEWAKEDGSLDIDNIAHPEKLKPYKPTPYVRTG